MTADSRMSDDFLLRISEKARDAFEWSGDPVIEDVSTWDQLYSVINKISIRCNGDTRVLYAKTLKNQKGRKGGASTSPIIREFEMLTALDPHFLACPRLGLVRVVAVLPENDTLVTEEAPGVALQTKIARAAAIYTGPWDKTPSLEYCRLAGQWLRKFEAATARPDADFATDDLISYCDKRLHTLMAKPGSGFSDETRGSIIRNIRDLEAHLGSDSRRISARHNDFSPHNIFADGGAIRVLDFGFSDYGSWAYDVYRFWHVLECLKSSPQFASSRISAFQEAFLRAYDRDIDLSAPILRMVGHRFQLTKLCAVYEDRNAFGLRGWVARRLYRKGRDWLLAQ